MSDTRTVTTITDPETGRIYPIPAGGSPDGEGGGEATSEGGESGDGAESSSTEGGTSETEESTEESESSTSSTEGEGDGEESGAGSKEAVLADLARERRKRQQAEKDLKAERAKSESDAERLEREIREEATAPAIKALRATAVETAARDAGFINVEDAIRDVNLEEIDVDLDAEIPGADRAQATKLVKALAKAKPYLLKSEGDGGGSGSGGSDHQAGGGSSNGSSSSSDPNATLRELFRKRTTRLSG